MKKNILIADDHLTVRMGIRYLVKDLLHDRCMVTEVTSGKQMLQQLKASPTPYDLAIMDMNMPEPCRFFSAGAGAAGATQPESTGAYGEP